MSTIEILKFARRVNEQLFTHEILMRIPIAITVRPLLSAVLGRTKFWSQKPRIIYNRGLIVFHISWAY